MLKGYKYEILPSDSQKELIWKTIGCNRLVYNLMLKKKIRLYEKKGKSLSKFDIGKKIVKLKKKEEYDFLNEIDSRSFLCTSEYLDQAFQRFFKGQNQFPKFHSKHYSRQSYTTLFVPTTNGGNIKCLFKQNLIQLPKLGKIEAKLYRKFIGQIKRATVSFSGNKYWVSFCVECKEPKKLPETTQCCGIDVGVKDFATIFSKEKVDGKHCSKVENPKNLKKSQDRIKKYQKDLSRKQKGSNNYVKAKKKLNKKTYKS